MNWEVDKNETSDSWLDVSNEWYWAMVTWDGCVNLHKYNNAPKSEQDKLPEGERDTDFIHICSIDEFIELLTELKLKAKQHFGEDWE